jgi:hypothetical protein
VIAFGSPFEKGRHQSAFDHALFGQLSKTTGTEGAVMILTSSASLGSTIPTSLKAFIGRHGIANFSVRPISAGFTLRCLRTAAGLESWLMKGILQA